MTRSIREVCERLRVGEHTVLKWIRSGELTAINVSRRTGGKPRWRITAEALDAFETLRSTTPPQRPTRKRLKKDANVVKFY
jgi:excisionase family DNA binding protein